MNVKLQESKLKQGDHSFEVEDNVLNLKTLDTNIIINQLESNLKTRLTAKNMFEVLK